MPTSAVFKGALIVTVVFRVLLVSPILRDAWIHARVTHLRDTRTCHGTAPVLVARLCENTTIKMLYLCFTFDKTLGCG